MDYRTYVARETDLSENEVRIEVMIPDQAVSYEVRMPILRIIINNQIAFSCRGSGVESFLEELADIASVMSRS